MFATVLVANRGEIAVRIIRTLRRLGVRSVAVYTEDELAGGAPPRHVRDADAAVRLPRGGYLDAEAIVEAALRTGAEAVHPGYGFLAENAAFARRCARAGLVFVGPPPGAIEAMGDKIRAKATVAAAGVPVLPGGAEPDDDLAEAARRIGFPVLVKPSAGGGGKGMLLVRSAEELPAALESARRTARAAFGDGTLLVERYVDRPRHIEIQVLADAYGSVVHLGERECSLQRRHQKIVEEAPSPLLDPETRARMGAAAVEAARAAGYVGAGTVEFIAHETGGRVEFFFLEMNTRLQVEHPVTEAVTGIDLVEAQLRVAAGEPLWFTQDEVRLAGHAIEARVYAEDPARGFLPTGGTVLVLREPEAAGVRVDSGLLPGTVVGTGFDPMLAKVIAHGPDRAEALRRLDAALAATTVLGVPTNVAYLRSLLADPAVVSGALDTGLAERHTPAPGPRDDALAAAALLLHDRPVGTDPWDIPDGWRIGERAWTRYRLRDGEAAVEVRVRGLAGAAEVAVGDGAAVPARLLGRRGDEVTAELGGVARRYAWARDGDVLWLGAGGAAWRFELAGERRERAAGRAGGGAVRSPMPGTVLLVKVAEGERVTRGQPLVIVEAMKMEHVVTAPIDGVVTELPARAGRPVELDALLAVVEPEEERP
ncbi:acetyl/propionyl-CoA carboxylase subuit alpha [Thermopolyspora flexuosa]|uniref:biotin carboxylase n=1 Tax=Thermopolyspora flexuosa TaxID=103836 RepID=A0A543IW49_9ACTN|nr:biotin carboxylase N-terminal domain-containing protein [Thermopolyspora flexuosa]TQM74804.1 acetyl-CoA/propionyl-CoA carboxylase biotin carboxyl carrier protein [Thermopolyspora flexuosa]GGM79060.1 acetyl/propionyl-CoA carboxylase subuit alpha [Thermopolyspora flexuosa]